MPVEFLEYKKQPVIQLTRMKGDKYPFRFGLGKAKLIVKHFKEIRDFVLEHDKKDEENPE